MCFGLTQIIYSFLQVLFDLTGTKPYMSPELHMASRSARRGYSYSVDWCAFHINLDHFRLTRYISIYLFIYAVRVEG